MVAGEPCPTGSSSSLAGISFYQGGPYPASYDGALFFADYSRDCIWVMKADASGIPSPGLLESFVAPAANPVDVQISPAGSSSTPISTAARSAASGSSAPTSRRSPSRARIRRPGRRRSPSPSTAVARAIPTGIQSRTPGISTATAFSTTRRQFSRHSRTHRPGASPFGSESPIAPAPRASATRSSSPSATVRPRRRSPLRPGASRGRSAT